MARVALYGGGGSPFHHAALLAAGGHEVAFVFPDEIRAGALRGFDALVVPGGGRRAMIGQLEPLGSAGARAIVSFVEAGGMYVSSCAGSYCAAAVGPAFRAACPVKDELDLLPAQVFNEDREQAFGLRSPGIGVLRLRNVAPEHPVMAGVPELFEIVHYNGPLFDGAQPLAVVDGHEPAFTRGLQFLDPSVPDDLIERAAAQAAASIVVGDRGSGRVVLFGSHPEFGVGPAMDDEPPMGRLLHNAVNWQLSESGPVELDRPPLAMDTEPGTAHATLVGDVGERVQRVRAVASRIGARGPSAWLQRRRAMALFGREPDEVLAGALADIDRLADEVAAVAPEVPANILGFHPAVAYDGGYVGVLGLLDLALEQLTEADARWEAPVGPDPVNAYANIADSPYHMVAASYLAAVGTVAAAALLSRAFVTVPAAVS
jgi:putative intracellular protease/amidase